MSNLVPNSASTPFTTPTWDNNWDFIDRPVWTDVFDKFACDFAERSNVRANLPISTACLANKEVPIPNSLFKPLKAFAAAIELVAIFPLKSADFPNFFRHNVVLL